MKNITLERCDIIKLLPAWMRADETNGSLAEWIDAVVPKLAQRMAYIDKWKNIDDMPEEMLDALAWERKISWYQYDADIRQKRDIVRSATKIHRKKGTKWAIEQVLTIYFDESKVMEWFEYGGIPGHFKVQTVNTATVDKDAERFLAVLDDVKRYSQVLDDIEVISGSTMELEYIIYPRSIERIVSELRD